MGAKEKLRSGIFQLIAQVIIQFCLLRFVFAVLFVFPVTVVAQDSSSTHDLPAPNSLSHSTSDQADVTLRSAIAQAAQNNPGVLASWNAFEAADRGVKAAKGGYLPRLDFIAEKGRKQTEDPQEIEESFDTESYRLTLTQMLFDGFATKNEVARQNYFKLARYYEFKQASEEVGLETAQAYLDILRFRELQELAKENYFQHLRYHSDIEERVNSGLGRGVDLEQAKARLALAESNVLTETTNLHDVSVRYHRLVGTFPAESFVIPTLPEGVIPSLRKEVFEKTFATNPQLNASIENIRATRADYKGRNAPMMPRFDLRLSKQVDENDRGVEGQFDEEIIEVVMTYNLYNGGSDRARRRQSKYLMYEATNTRDRVCREVRQTAAIAYNDIQTQAKLIEYLNRNEQAISKAREAYKNQFDIGQRTLLDLLDTENEYFEVKRTLVDARYNHLLAEIRTLASMGLLLYSLDIVGSDKDVKDKLDLSREESLNAKCPAEAPAMKNLDFDLDEILGRTSVNSLSIEDLASGTEGPFGKESTTIELDIKFDTGSSTVRDDMRPEISRIARFLCSNAQIKSLLEGHTDSTGTDRFNLKLSQARADSVRREVIKECPDAQTRISSIGFGESLPMAANNSSLGRANNRRVKLVLNSIPDESSIDIIEETLDIGFAEANNLNLYPF